MLYTVYRYSVSTNFRLPLIEPSAREVYIFLSRFEREERRGRVRSGKNNMVTLTQTRNSVRAQKNC